MTKTTYVLRRYPPVIYNTALRSRDPVAESPPWAVYSAGNCYNRLLNEGYRRCNSMLQKVENLSHLVLNLPAPQCRLPTSASERSRIHFGQYVAWCAYLHSIQLAKLQLFQRYILIRVEEIITLFAFCRKVQ